MKNGAIALALAAALTAGCSNGQAAYEVPAGSDVTVQKKDGVTVSGRLVEVQAERVVVEAPDGGRTIVRRSDISSLRAAAKPSEPVAADRATLPEPPVREAGAPKAPERVFDRRPEYREVTVPAGTVLPLELTSTVASDASNVEDPVRATLRRSIRVEGLDALPAGSAVSGNVVAAERAGRVKGRAHVAFRFTRLDPPGDGERLSIRTSTVTRQAPATKKRDAAKIGGGAVGGAIVGGILGGKDGAAKGAAVGGAAGTGVVLATRGKEVRLGPGADIAVRLTAPLTVRVPLKK